MAGALGITGEDIRDATISDRHIAPGAAVAEAKLLYDTGAGHNHDGVNSRLLAGGGGSDMVVDASFTGAVDGVNATFTFSQNYKPNTLAVYRAGIRQKRGVHFTEVGPNQVLFSTPPATGRTLVFDFVPA